MALIQSLGFKQESPRRRNTGDNSLLSDYSNINPNRRSHQQFDYESKSNLQPLQQLNQNSFYSTNNNNNRNNNNTAMFSNIDSSQQLSTLFGSPNRTNQRSKLEIKEDIHHNTSHNDNNNSNNRYSTIPRKSMLSSGLGAISPIPPKYNNENININHNKLDLTNINSNNTNEPNLSPIKPNNNKNNTLFSDNTLHLNTTHNTTLNLSNIAPSQMESRMSIIHANNDINITNNKQILIIGFPPSEAKFIHHKFRQYGNGIVNTKLTKNTLFLQYLNKQGAKRALDENAKWIKNGNLKYMISVIYYDIAKQNNEQTGRFLNLSEMNANHDMNRSNHTRHFVSNTHQNVEKEFDLQSGPTHILWKIFNFITTGW